MVKLAKNRSSIDLDKHRRIDLEKRGGGIDLKKGGGGIDIKKRGGRVDLRKRGGRIDLSKRARVVERIGKPPIKTVKEPLTGTVPYGFGFYGTPNRPIDPRDCSLYPDSPWCGGVPWGRNFAGLDLDVVQDKCNIGLRVTGDLGFTALPPLEVVYRKKECRREQPDPEDRPDWINKKPKDFENGVFSSPNGADLYYTELIRIGNRYVEHFLETEEVFFYHNLGERHNFTEGGGFERSLEEELDSAGYRILHDAGAELLPSDPLFVASQVKKWEIFTEIAPQPDHQPGVIWHEFTSKKVYLRLLEFQQTWLSPNLSTGEPKLSTYGGKPYHDVIYEFHKVHYEFESIIGYTPAITNFFDLQDIESGTNFIKSKAPFLAPPPPHDKKDGKKCKCMKCCNNSNRQQRRNNKKLKNVEKKIDEICAALDCNTLKKGLKRPANVLDPDAGSRKYHTIPGLIAWNFLQLEGLIGKFPIKLTFTDPDLLQEGEKEQEVVIPNLAEAITEIIGHGMTNSDLGALNNQILARSIMESASARKTAIETYYMVESLIEYFGYGINEKDVEVPFAFNICPEQLENLIFSEVLQCKMQPIKIREFDHKDKDWEKILQRLLLGAEIIREVFFRNIAPGESLGQAVMNDLAAVDEEDYDPWDAWRRKVERGFTAEVGNANTTKPYGRESNFAPDIREIGQDGDARKDL